MEDTEHRIKQNEITTEDTETMERESENTELNELNKME